MPVGADLRTAGTALKRWFIAQLIDSAAVGTLWLVGLLIIGVPWAPLWAFLGAVLQFIPGLGAVLAMIGPALTALYALDPDHALYVLILYAVIVATDGLLLQPYIMRRTARVPIWASIVTPLVLGILIPFWGVLLSPPLLAIVYAFKSRSGSAGVPPAVPPAGAPPV